MTLTIRELVEREIAASGERWSAGIGPHNRELKKGQVRHIYQDIVGYFDFADFYVAIVQYFPSGSRFVEVGSYQGCSLAHLVVEVINSGKDIQVWAIDDFGKNWKEYNTQEDLLEKFKKNMKPLEGHFSALCMDSAEGARAFEDESLDFVYIDATHLYEPCLRDIRAWTPKIKPGGVIAGHDYQWGGVKQAVAECFGNEIDVTVYTWWHQFPKETA